MKSIAQEHSDPWSQSLQSLRNGEWPDHCSICTGRWDAGPGFEATPTFGRPVWNGESDHTVLVNADFGVGDTIQFWRFVPEAAKRVRRLILRCDPDLHPLLASAGVEFASSELDPPASDSIIHLMSLPKLLDVSREDISGAAYLAANRDFEVNPLLFVLATRAFTKVGFCWTGNPFSPTNPHKAIPAEEFDRLFVVEGFRPFNLVKHESPPAKYLDARAFMNDWNSTAALLGIMDLVITVDTAVAHLAGALGRPTWLLLRHDRDWRWGNLDRTPWYDSVRIFREETSIQEMLEQVAQSLKMLE